MSKLVYYLFYALSLLPFGMLYALSDCFYVLVYHVARYRRSIVHENLSTAFPEKSSEEI
jgi:KDO2-lipid IV(A) lauroyltransferase